MGATPGGSRPQSGHMGSESQQREERRGLWQQQQRQQYKGSVQQVLERKVTGVGRRWAEVGTS